MAKTLDKIGITTGNTVEAYHVSQSIDAFAGLEEYDIALSGSFNLTGSMTIDGLTTPIVPNIITFDPSTNTLHTTSSIGFLQPLSSSVYDNATNILINSSSISSLSSSISSIPTSSGNFANTDLTFTGNRTHELNGFDLVIEEGSQQTIAMFNGFATQITFDNSIWEIASNYQDFSVSGSTSLSLLENEAVFNDPGNNYNFRVEGDTDVNLLFVDASTDKVGIGINTPTTKLDVSGSLCIRETTLDNTLDNILVVDNNGVVHKRESSTITTTKPPLFIYAGSDPLTKTINGFGIGKSSAGTGNQGLISTPTLTMEVTKSLSYGDQIIWNTKISDSTIAGFKLLYNNNYLIGNFASYAPIIQADISSFLTPPDKVLFELEMIKFSTFGDDKFRFNLKQTNFYQKPSLYGGIDDPVTTTESNFRYSIPNTQINPETDTHPQQVLTFDTLIGIIPSTQISNVKLELNKGGGGALGVDSSYCRLIQA